MSHAVRIASSDVAWPRINSTSPISGTGFMKCIPSTWAGRFVAAPSRVIEMGDVHEPHVESGLRKHLGDAVAHRAGADHGDCLDVHQHGFAHDILSRSHE